MSSIERQLTECLRQHLEGHRQPLPDAGRLAWGWFLDLCRTRTSNGYGPNPISHTEIEAYARLYRWPLEPRHVDLILAMDRVWMDKARAAGTRASGAGVAQQAEGQPCTPEAFDAVFG
jgi:hypothetical protein